MPGIWIAALKSHCLYFKLVPRKHVISFNKLGKAEYEELKDLKKCIIDYFESKSCKVIFVEKSFDFEKLKHCVLEIYLIKKITNKELDFEVIQFLKNNQLKLKQL